jgi:chlorophyll(ide) b reductase
VSNICQALGGGHVFNMLGAGSDGNATRKFAAYGFTKAGLGQLTKTLASEEGRCRLTPG